MSGLLAIRDKQVMHRDLKLPNILIHFPQLKIEDTLQEGQGFDLKEYIKNLDIVGGKNGEGAVPFEIKIADLGFARKLD